jgi:hypothetical protein
MHGTYIYNFVICFYAEDVGSSFCGALVPIYQTAASVTSLFTTFGGQTFICLLVLCLVVDRKYDKNK